MSDYEKLNLAISAIGHLVIAIGLLFAARQLQLSAKAHRDNQDWNRRFAAQQALIDGRELEIKRQLDTVISLSAGGSRIPLTDLQEKFLENADFKALVHRFLNIHEGYARGIFEGIYDEDIIKNGRRSVLLRAHDTYYEYINHTRKLNPLAWDQLERLSNKWKLEERTPIYRMTTGA